MKRLWNKKIISRTLCILFVAVLAVWAFTPETTWAQGQAAAAAGKGFSSALNKSGNLVATVGYTLGILWLIQTFLSTIALAFASAMLNFAYTLNLMTNPADMVVVQEGWRVLRDLSNGILILIIVWIALTIIFDLEEYGGKKLLVRVIVAGLLINFSLAFTAIPFALGNQLARPFAKALNVPPECVPSGQTKCNTLSDIIINNSQIHQVTEIVDTGKIDEFQKNLETRKEAAARQPAGSAIGQYFGVPTAHAAGFLAILGLAVLQASVAVIASVIVNGLVLLGAYLAEAHIMALNMAVANILLFFTIISIATAAILLLLRATAMIFLGVFAPVAFIAMAVPRYGERVWNMWLENLLRWAFMAPVFYFLLYLALLMLQVSAEDIKVLGLGGINITANLFKVINLVLFLVFLWASIYFTRKMAGQFAEIALSGLRRGLGYAGGYGLGVLQRRALPYLGQAAEATGVRIGEIKSPFLRKLLKQPTGALRGVAWAGREQVRRDATRLGSMTSPELQRAIGSGEFSESERAAAMMVLRQRRDLTPMKDSKGNAIRGYDEAAQRRGVDTIRRAGLDIADFLRANPLLARPTDYRSGQLEDEQKEILKVMNSQRARDEQPLTLDQVRFNDVEVAQRLAQRSIRPEHIPQMDMGVFDNTAEMTLSDGRTITQGNHMKELALDLWRGEHYNRLGRESPKVAGDIQDYLEKEPEGKRIWDRMDDKKQDYFSTNTAQELSWKRPTYAAGAGTAGGQGTPVFGARALRDGQAGTSYTADLQPRGGTPPFTFRTINGTGLPPGLAFDPPGATADATRRIAGTPTAAGTYRVAIQMTDSAGAASERTFTIIITAPPTP